MAAAWLSAGPRAAGCGGRGAVGGTAAGEEGRQLVAVGGGGVVGELLREGAAGAGLRPGAAEGVEKAARHGWLRAGRRSGVVPLPPCSDNPLGRSRPQHVSVPTTG